jgi:hypothetical protein
MVALQGVLLKIFPRDTLCTFAAAVLIILISIFKKKDSAAVEAVKNLEIAFQKMHCTQLQKYLINPVFYCNDEPYK